jgi:hypothetical protein
MVTNKTPGKFSTYLAITSFSIGTLLLAIHLCFPNNIEILVTGFFYIILALLVNSITLFHLLYHFIINQFERETIAIRILILLANIPITLIYLNIIFNNNLF